MDEPDLQIEDLGLIVHGRQFPEATDYWDGNWLNVTAEIDAPASRVVASGPIVHLGDLDHFLNDLIRLYASLGGTAELPCIEPNLRVKLNAKPRGHIAMSLSITPDHLSERHEYSREFDQSYLPAIIEQLRDILRRYPIRR
jgi:hypothetical protein